MLDVLHENNLVNAQQNKQPKDEKKKKKKMKEKIILEKE